MNQRIWIPHKIVNILNHYHGLFCLMHEQKLLIRNNKNTTFQDLKETDLTIDQKVKNIRSAPTKLGSDRCIQSVRR